MSIGSIGGLPSRLMYAETQAAEQWTKAAALRTDNPCASAASMLLIALSRAPVGQLAEPLPYFIVVVVG